MEILSWNTCSIFSDIFMYINMLIVQSLAVRLDLNHQGPWFFTGCTNGEPGYATNVPSKQFLPFLVCHCVQMMNQNIRRSLEKGKLTIKFMWLGKPIGRPCTKKKVIEYKMQRGIQQIVFTIHHSHDTVLQNNAQQCHFPSLCPMHIPMSCDVQYA